MEAFLLDHETWVRSGAFLLVFVLMGLAEGLIPARKRQESRARRWTRNLSIMALGGLGLRFLIPLLAVGVAIKAETAGFGLFNLTPWPAWLEVALAIILLDLIIYAQHLVMHHVPMLWRLHRTHHADPELDVTTGGRFHPLEIWLSMGVKMTAVALLGAPVAAVILFEVILSSMALFNHSNLRLPPRLDRALRKLVVTPAMHRVHHSPVPAETNSNFGFNLSLWDRLFGTYRQSVAREDPDFPIGLWSHRDPAYGTFGALMLDPLRNVRDNNDKAGEGKA